MNKVCASILVFIALFALAGAEGFKRLPLDQGVLRMRNLATATTPKYTFVNYTNLTAATVNLGSYYLNNTATPNTTQTDMVLFLFTNITGFCKDCREFIKFGCENNNCSADTTQTQSMISPYYQVTSGNPFNFSNLTIGSDGSAWQLKTTALVYTYGNKDYNNLYLPGPTQSYIRNESTYGFIGLGVGGNAAKNFQTTTPIFSIQMNTTGNGSLIFGKDTTLYDSKRTPMILTTDTNWNMISRNMSWGPLVNNTNYISNVIFDLQHPGIGLSQPYYSNILYSFISKYNFTNDNSYGNTDYTYIYNGSLSNLPSLIFGLANGQNLTLPPSAYTRNVAPNIYALLVYYSPPVRAPGSGQDVNYTVLGWPVLSQFYTVFELPTTGIPTVTMYPTYNATANSTSSSSSSFSMKTLAIVAAIVLIVLVALSAVCKKKTDFTKSDLGVELRAARV